MGLMGLDGLWWFDGPLVGFDRYLGFDGPLVGFDAFYGPYRILMELLGLNGFLMGLNGPLVYFRDPYSLILGSGLIL